MAECRLTKLYCHSKKNDKFIIIEKIKGSHLVGQEYEPLYPYFNSYRAKGGFKILEGSYVNEKDGTGIVHCAPGFNQDDLNICIEKGIIEIDKPPVSVDENGYFTENIIDFKGVFNMDADALIKKDLKSRGLLLIDS